MFNWQQSDRSQFSPRSNFATYAVRSWRPLLSWSEQHALMNLLLQPNDKQQIFSFWVTCFSQGWLHHLHCFTQRHISKRRSVKDLVYNVLNTSATQFYSVWFTQPDSRHPAVRQSTSIFTHEAGFSAEACQEGRLLYVSVDCHGVCSSLRRSTPQLWTCGQWAAYLASFSPRSLFSLENPKSTKSTRFSR